MNAADWLEADDIKISPIALEEACMSEFIGWAKFGEQKRLGLDYGSKRALRAAMGNVIRAYLKAEKKL